MLHSAHAARNFLKALPSMQSFQKMTAIVGAQVIADEFLSLNWPGKCIVSASPSPDDMLHCLSELSK